MKKKKKRQRICVIGLGQFGRQLARSLARSAEVLALDRDEERVDRICNEVHQARVVDASDGEALSRVVTDQFDEAVVSMGESLESSILCTLHLKKIGVPMIRAKAENHDHATILTTLGAQQIIYPERETAMRVAAQILNPNLLDFIPVAEDYRVVDSRAPTPFVGKSLMELDLRNRMGVFVIAVKKDDAKFKFLPGPNYVVESGDVLVLIGQEDRLVSLGELDREPARKPTTPKSGSA